MTIDPSLLRAGDVLVVDAPAKGVAGLGGWFVQLRARLMGEPDLHDHVAIFSHWDTEGQPRGYEGRPSSFGQVNLTKYLKHPMTISNASQPKTDRQREGLMNLCQQSMGIPYDWAAIMGFGLTTVGLPFLPEEWPTGGLPAQGVCSSLLALLYARVGLLNPGTKQGRYRSVDVDDWTVWVAVAGWLRP